MVSPKKDSDIIKYSTDDKSALFKVMATEEKFDSIANLFLYE